MDLKNRFKSICYFSLGVVFLVTTSVKAAEPTGWSLVGGLNFATLSTSQSGVSSAADLGFNLGGQYYMPLSKNTGISISGLYSMKNSKYTAGSQEAKNKNQFLEVPVLYQYALESGITLSAGAYLSYLLSAQQEYNGTSTDVKSYFNSTDFGLQLGAAYKTNAWNIGLAYQLGLTDVTNTSADNKFSNLMLSVGYSF